MVAIVVSKNFSTTKWSKRNALTLHTDISFLKKKNQKDTDGMNVEQKREKAKSSERRKPKSRSLASASV